MTICTCHVEHKPGCPYYSQNDPHEQPQTEDRLKPCQAHGLPVCWCTKCGGEGYSSLKPSNGFKKVVDEMTSDKLADIGVESNKEMLRATQPSKEEIATMARKHEQELGDFMEEVTRSPIQPSKEGKPFLGMGQGAQYEGRLSPEEVVKSFPKTSKEGWEEVLMLYLSPFVNKIKFPLARTVTEAEAHDDAKNALFNDVRLLYQSLLKEERRNIAEYVRSYEYLGDISPKLNMQNLAYGIENPSVLMAHRLTHDTTQEKEK